jgi:hypothetical protein
MAGSLHEGLRGDVNAGIHITLALDVSRPIAQPEIVPFGDVDIRFNNAGKRLAE